MSTYKHIPLWVIVILLTVQTMFSQAPPILRNSWTTNTAGTPVRGVNNLSVTNAGSGTNWLFYGITPQTVARLTDVTNVSTNGPFIRTDSTGRGTNTTFVTAFTNLDNWVSSTGVLDTAIGVNVQPLGGNAKRNTFIGYDIATGFAIDSGNDFTNSDNIAIGSSLMLNLYGGYRNVAIGSTALQGLIDGSANIGIGYRALTSMKGGGSSIGIGDGAFFSLTNGYANVGVGIEAGLNATNTEYVTAFGHHAGYGSFPGVSPGSYSTWIGGHSGGLLRTNIIHKSTTAIGYLAGFQGGSNCTYLGAYAGRQNSNDNNVLIIDGVERSSYALEKSDSLIYGNLHTLVASQRLLVNAGVLSVPSGRIGVGTTNTSTGIINAISAANGTPIYMSDGVVNWGFMQGTLGLNIPGAWIETINNFPLFFAVNSGNPAMSISTSGKVGIGSTNAAANLDVWGLSTTGAAGFTAIPAQIQSTDAAAVGTGAALGLGGNYSGTSKYNFAHVQGVQDTAAGFGGALIFWTTSSGDDSPEANSGNYQRMRITKRGLVGIRTNAPQAQLHVIGNGAFSDLLRVGTTAKDSRFSVSTNGNVSVSGSVTVTNSLSVSNLVVGVNNAANVTNILAASATLDFPSTSVGAVADMPITVTGAESGDVVSIGVPPGSITTIIGSFFGFASNNTVFVRFIPTAAAQDPGSGTFRALVTKF